MKACRAWLAGAAVSLATACAVAADPPPPAAVPTPAASAPAAAADSRPPGQRLYARHCLSCHQSDGGGVPNMQPPIVGGTWVKGDPKALALFVMTGGFGSAARKDAAVDNVMPEFRQLPDEELAEILSYIRAKFGGGASAVTAAEVAAARASGE
jgi:mono/diheme cytochrome c family protein